VFGTVKNLMRPKYSKTPQKHHLSALIEYTNEEDIHHITTYLIDKNQRMSKKLLDEILKDLEYY
jgi:hypothetical protein